MNGMISYMKANFVYKKLLLYLFNFGFLTKMTVLNFGINFFL